MGEPGALESYVVPFVGQMIPTGNFTLSKDTNSKVRETRKATEEDCYLYPNLRLFISQTGDAGAYLRRTLLGLAWNASSGSHFCRRMAVGAGILAF